MKFKLPSTDEDVQVSLIHSIYKTQTKTIINDTGEKIELERDTLVKEIRVKKWFKKEAIVSIEEYVTTKHTVAKQRSIIFDKYSNKHYATHHNIEDLWSIINRKHNSVKDNIIGFNFKEKK